VKGNRTVCERVNELDRLYLLADAAYRVGNGRLFRRRMARYETLKSAPIPKRLS
jgi:hypothetical protein